ncbi:XdhC family protein [Kitasatospora sp. NPDC088346]|uniref:XdhC family protein n=1 Tax=Kitasatospora sp. NPDC088346 TaxID=3364073 RepID=UPI0037F6A0DF
MTPPSVAACWPLGEGLGYELRAVRPEEVPTAPRDPSPGSWRQALAGVAAVVVASHGRDEEALLTAAARAGVPYVALVASGRRGTAVLAGLELDTEERERIHTPAGLWIGARTPGEIAVSILAELVASRHAVAVHSEAVPVVPDSASDAAAAGVGAGAGEPEAGPRTAVDPVCGMTVAVVPDTVSSDVGGHRHWFCSDGCRDRFESAARVGPGQPAP